MSSNQASGPSTSMIRAMQEMEEFERKHAVGVNRGKFFAADPPESQIVRDAVTGPWPDPNSAAFDLIEVAVSFKRWRCRWWQGGCWMRARRGTWQSCGRGGVNILITVSSSLFPTPDPLTLLAQTHERVRSQEGGMAWSAKGRRVQRCLWRHDTASQCRPIR